MKELNERQLKRIEALATVVGSIKTPFDINATEIINELRGKEVPENAAILNRTYDFVFEDEYNDEYDEYISDEKLNKQDPLDVLLSTPIDEVVEMVRCGVNDYMEEGHSKGVAKVKALEDVILWYYGDKEKELKLRKSIQNI